MFQNWRRRRFDGTQPTDLKRWSQSENLRKGWDKRAPFAAALCFDSRIVCDIGCGNQALRSLLPPRIKYLPADLVRRTDDTAVCDLNKMELPLDYLKQADTVTLLGVIEYIHDVKWVLKTLSSHVDTLIVSYNPSDMININRKKMGWVNDYSNSDLTTLLVSSGYTLNELNLVDSGQVIFRCVAER